jgi:hypothetical protein
MAYIWFNAVLEALGKRINFESVSNFYGNAFAKDAQKIVQAANPLLKNGGKQDSGVMGLMGQIKIIDARTTSKEAQKKAEKRILGDTSWAEGLM